jgi:DNA-binding winged helix-turn-helix (wHTH) protein
MQPSSQLCFPPFRLDLSAEQLWHGDQLVPLRRKPFAVLRYLAEHPGRLVTQDELRKAVWANTHVSEAILRVNIREVRVALADDAGVPRLIETVPRRGYRFLASVQRHHGRRLQSPTTGASCRLTTCTDWT